MQQKLNAEHWVDDSGNPSGGYTGSTGLDIFWQNGPLVVDGVRREPNGCFVETVIVAAIDRLEFYQGTRFACQANADAITHLESALRRLHERTADRVSRGVEGTHQQ